MSDQNININGGNIGGLQIGNGNTQSIHQSSSQQVTFEQFLEQLKKDIASGKDAPIEQDIESDIIEPLRAIAAEPAPESEQDRVTLKARIASCLEQLEPYAPFIRQYLAAFAEGALSTLPPPAGWIIGGLIELVRHARGD